MPQFVKIKDLDKLMDGAVTELFRHEFIKLLDNICDPNTRAEAVRKITLCISVKPNSERSGAAFNVAVKSSPAPLTPLSQTVFIHQNDDGSVTMVEKSDTLPGQVSMEGETYIPKVLTFNDKTNT
jgi:hypothetical protein